MRITKFSAKCPRCGGDLTIYPRHIEHHEPVVCPQCGRFNSADEFDLRDQIAAAVREAKRIAGREP